MYKSAVASYPQGVPNSVPSTLRRSLCHHRTLRLTEAHSVRKNISNFRACLSLFPLPTSAPLSLRGSFGKLNFLRSSCMNFLSVFTIPVYAPSSRRGLFCTLKPPFSPSCLSLVPPSIIVPLFRRGSFCTLESHFASFCLF